MINRAGPTSSGAASQIGHPRSSEAARPAPPIAVGSVTSGFSAAALKTAFDTASFEKSSGTSAVLCFSLMSVALHYELDHDTGKPAQVFPVAFFASLDNLFCFTSSIAHRANPIGTHSERDLQVPSDRFCAVLRQQQIFLAVAARTRLSFNHDTGFGETPDRFPDMIDILPRLYRQGVGTRREIDRSHAKRPEFAKV